MDKETTSGRCTYLTTKISVRRVAWMLALVIAFKLTVTYFSQDRSSDDADYHKNLVQEQLSLDDAVVDFSTALNIEKCCLIVIKSDIQILDPAMKTWFGLASNVTHFEEDLNDLGSKMANLISSTACSFSIVIKGHF